MKLNINDKQGIELLHWIFERELAPPFELKAGNSGTSLLFNVSEEFIGYLRPSKNDIILRLFDNPYLQNIEYKVCAAFELNRFDWRGTIRPTLISWFESHLNMKIELVI